MLRFTLLLSLLTFVSITNFVSAACPVSPIIATGTATDECGNSSTGGPQNKTCCITKNTASTLYRIYNGGTTHLAAMIAASNVCATDVMIPGFNATEWTKFSSTFKLACITVTTIPNNTWLGTESALWSNPGNWSNNVVPSGAGTTASFDATNCKANCTAVTMDMDPGGVNVSITSTAGLTITAGAVAVNVGTWTQNGTSSVFDGTNALSFTSTGLVTLTVGTFKPSTAVFVYPLVANTFNSLTVNGGTFNAITTAAATTASAIVTGAVSVSAGKYSTSTSGTDQFQSTVGLSGTGIINSGNSLAVTGAITQATGTTWTLGTTNTFSGAVGISGGTMAVPNIATTAASFNSTLTISGTGAMTVGAAASVTTTGLLTVSSSTSNAYNSTGTDNFNGGVTLSGSGGMTTGPTLTENGAVSITTGTWTITSGTNNFNNNGSNGVTISGGTLLPFGTVNFKASATSLTMTGGTFGATTTTGTLNFTGAVLLSPSVGNITFHNGTSTVAITGALTIRDGSAGLSIFGDGLGGSGTFGSLAMEHVSGATGTFPNALFTQGSTVLSMGNFSLSTTTGTSTTRGSQFTGGTANMTVTGNFTFDCSTVLDKNAFTGTSGNLEIDGATVIINNTATCKAGNTSQFNIANSNLKILGGTQSIAGTITALTVASLETGFTGATQSKTLSPALTITNTATLSDSSFSGGTTTFGSTSTVGTGVTITGAGGTFVNTGAMSITSGGITINSSGNTTITNTGGMTVAAGGMTITSSANTTLTNTATLALTNGNLVVNSTAGTTTLNLTSTATIGSSGVAGDVTINPTGAGAIVLNGPGILYVNGNLTSTNAGSSVSGNVPITMTGSLSPVLLTMGSSGNLGTTGDFTIDKASGANIVALDSSGANINTTAQKFIINKGTVKLNHNVGTATCDGADICNLTMDNLYIKANGSLICGVGTITTGTTTLIGGSISCSSYPYTWTGGGADHNWTTGGNWFGGSAPTANTTAIFDNTCSQCDATINSDISIAALSIQSTYAGTITQSANIITGAYYQAAGTFTGGAFTLTDTGDFSIAGGVFTSPSGATIFAPTSNSSLIFESLSTSFSGDVSFAPTATSVFNITNTINVAGTLSIGNAAINCTLSGGTINYTGTTVNTSGSAGCTGTTNLSLNSVNSNISSTSATANFPEITIMAGKQATFTSGQTFNINGGFTNSGTLVATGATFDFNGTGTITSGTGSFENVTFTPAATATFTLSDQMNITGTLTLNPSAGTCTINTGTLNTTGATVNFSGALGCTGTSTVKMANTAGTTSVNASGGAAAIPKIEIASTGTAVTFTSGHTFNFTNIVTLTTGTTNFSGTSNFTNALSIPSGFTANFSGTSNFTGTFTVASGGIVTLNGTANFNNTGNPSFVVSSGGYLDFVSGSTSNFFGSYSVTVPAALYVRQLGTSSIVFQPNANVNITAGGTNVAYGNVSFNPNTNTVFTLSDTMNISGTMQLGYGNATCTINTGIINYSGTTIDIKRGCNGTSTLNLIADVTPQDIAITESNTRTTWTLPNVVWNNGGAGTGITPISNLTISSPVAGTTTVTATSLTFNGVGTITIGNANALVLKTTGSVTYGNLLSAGDLITINKGASASSNITYSSTGAQSVQFNSAVTIAGDIPQIVSSTGTITMSGNNSLTGLLSTSSTGILTLNNTVTSLSGPITLFAGSTLNIQGNLSLPASTSTGVITQAAGTINQTAATTVTLGNLNQTGAASSIYNRNGGTLNITPGSGTCTTANVGSNPGPLNGKCGATGRIN